MIILQLQRSLLRSHSVPISNVLLKSIKVEIVKVNKFQVKVIKVNRFIIKVRHARRPHRCATRQRRTSRVPPGLKPRAVGGAPAPDKPSLGVLLGLKPPAVRLDDILNNSVDGVTQMIKDRISGDAVAPDTVEPLEPPSKRKRILPPSWATKPLKPQAKPHCSTAPQPKSSGAGKVMKGKVMKKPSAAVAARNASAVDRWPEHEEDTLAFKNPDSNGALTPRYFETEVLHRLYITTALAINDESRQRQAARMRKILAASKTPRRHVQAWSATSKRRTSVDESREKA